MCKLGSGSRLLGDPGKTAPPLWASGSPRPEVREDPQDLHPSPAWEAPAENKNVGGHPAQETSFPVQVAQLTAPLFSGCKPDTAKQKPDSCWLSPL